MIIVLWSGIEVVITRLTRNQLYSNVPWVRIPPAPPQRVSFYESSSFLFYIFTQCTYSCFYFIKTRISRAFALCKFCQTNPYARKLATIGFFLLMQCTSHRFPLRDLGHLRIIQPRIALDAGIAQISVHTVDLCQVFAAADRTHIHI